MLTEQLRNQGPSPIQEYGIIMGWEIDNIKKDEPLKSITGWSTWCKKTRKWRAGITINDRKKSLGSYTKKHHSQKALEIGLKYAKAGGQYHNVRNHVDKKMFKWMLDNE